jgi:hypothetical protein
MKKPVKKLEYPDSIPIKLTCKVHLPRRNYGLAALPEGVKDARGHWQQCVICGAIIDAKRRDKERKDKPWKASPLPMSARR